MPKSLMQVFKSAETTGDLIKAFRKNFDISQEEMQAICGIGQSNLSAIESNKRVAGATVALKLAAFMGVNPELIMFPKGFENEPEYIKIKLKAKRYLEKVP